MTGFETFCVVGSEDVVDKTEHLSLWLACGAFVRDQPHVRTSLRSSDGDVPDYPELVVFDLFLTMAVNAAPGVPGLWVVLSRCGYGKRGRAADGIFWWGLCLSQRVGSCAWS